MSTLQDEREKAAQLERAAEEERHIFNFLKATPACSPCEANIGILRNFLDGVEITPASLREAYEILSNQDPSPLSLRSERTIEHQELRERKKLVDAIMELKEGPEDWLEVERKRLMLLNPTTQEFVKSIDDLKTILEEAELRQKFKAMSVAELKAFVKPSEPAAEILPSKFSAAILKAMAPGAIRQLIGRYGVGALNSRLAGEN